MLALLFISGISFVAGGPKPGSVDATFPWWLRAVWGWVLLLGASLSLFGLAEDWRRTHAAGMCAIAWVAFFYSLALLYRYAPGSWLQAAVDLFLCVVAANRARGLQVRA